MSTFKIVKSKSKLCNRTTYIREFKRTFFAFKKIYHIIRITIQGPLRMPKDSSDSAFLNFVVSLTESHTSHKRFVPSHGLDLPYLFNCGKTALTK